MLVNVLYKCRLLLTMGVGLALAGCDVATLPNDATRPAPAPVIAPAPAPVQSRPTSQKSAQLRSYFNSVQSAQLRQGLLRRDGGGPDTPFTAEMLARNFEQIAFYNEYNSNFSGVGGRSPLRRWSQPVRMEVVFGAGVSPTQRNSDTYNVQQYAARLARATGHPIGTTGAPNFIVIIASEDDRAEALTYAASRVPGITRNSLIALNNLRRDTYCAVAAFAGGTSPNTYTAAVAVIRSENPDLLRLACIHEELAQGLGLANDSPGARPSIFNDDDEFAFLTTHDELLLRMLYDPRLRPGMNATTAAPIVTGLARALVGGPV